MISPDKPFKLRRIPNENGTLIMLALKAYNEPATYSNVLSFLSNGRKVIKHAIKNSVLDTGVRYGYLGKKKRRYFIHNDLRENRLSEEKLPTESKGVNLGRLISRPSKCGNYKGKLRHCRKCCLCKAKTDASCSKSSKNSKTNRHSNRRHSVRDNDQPGCSRMEIDYVILINTSH